MSLWFSSRRVPKTDKEQCVAMCKQSTLCVMRGTCLCLFLLSLLSSSESEVLWMIPGRGCGTTKAIYKVDRAKDLKSGDEACAILPSAAEYQEAIKKLELERCFTHVQKCLGLKCKHTYHNA